MKQKIPASILLIVGALFTWSFYRLLYDGIGEVLQNFGIVNGFAQNIIIVIAMGLILVSQGKHIKKYLR
jgi:hypothetical protein